MPSIRSTGHGDARAPEMGAPLPTLPSMGDAAGRILGPLTWPPTLHTITTDCAEAHRTRPSQAWRRSPVGRVTCSVRATRHTLLMYRVDTSNAQQSEEVSP